MNRPPSLFLWFWDREERGRKEKREERDAQEGWLINYYYCRLLEYKRWDLSFRGWFWRMCEWLVSFQEQLKENSFFFRLGDGCIEVSFIYFFSVYVII